MKEQTILDLILENNLSQEDLELISGNLACILTTVFAMLEKNNMHYWSIDDLMADTTSQSEKKVTIQGKV